MKEYTIYNMDFLRKLFARKLKRGIARIECDMEEMAFKNKVRFVVHRLSKMRFFEARMILEFWENNEDIMSLLRECQIQEFKLIREYKGRKTPGVIIIHFTESFDAHFLEVLITKHYGYELAKADSLSVWPFLAIDDGKQIIAIKLYDDRGFYEYIWLK